jgi:hypothetical protein
MGIPLNPSSVDEQMSCFTFLAILANAVLNILVHVDMHKTYVDMFSLFGTY